MNVPLEHDEAVSFVQWCQYQKIDVWHIPQETYTTSWKQKTKNRQEGVRSGISDFLVYLPVERCKFQSGALLWIELKRRRNRKKSGEFGVSPSKVSDEQLDFIKKMNTVKNVQGEICYGSAECVEFVKRFLKDS